VQRRSQHINREGKGGTKTSGDARDTEPAERADTGISLSQLTPGVEDWKKIKELEKVTAPVCPHSFSLEKKRGNSPREGASWTKKGGVRLFGP